MDFHLFVYVFSSASLTFLHLFKFVFLGSLFCQPILCLCFIFMPIVSSFSPFYFTLEKPNFLCIQKSYTLYMFLCISVIGSFFLLNSSLLVDKIFGLSLHFLVNIWDVSSSE